MTLKYSIPDPWITMETKMMERLIFHLLKDLKNTDRLTPQFRAKVARQLMRYKLKEAMTKQFAIIRM